MTRLNPANAAWVLSICWLLAGGSALAAPGRDHPATGTPDEFFGLTNLYTFHLTIPADQWAIMEELDGYKASAQRPQNNNGPGRFAPGQPGGGVNRPGGGPGGNRPMMGLEFKKGTATLEFQGQPCGAIRVRFKGNSSFNFARNSLKRSLKLDFNDLEKGRTFFGLTKLNLNNNAMDPSQLREALAYRVFRHGGVPAGRTAFARVFITVAGTHDKAYAGLYTVVEQVDDGFLQARFGTQKGLLLKPERLQGLPYLGPDWAAYTNQVQSKHTATTADTQRFIEFVKCLNSADDAQFQAAVDGYVDVDEFLRFIAVEGLLANMDSPLLSGHNYYLYLHPKTRKFVWLPWDMNEAFGGFGPGGSANEQMNLSLDQPFASGNRLPERLLQMPAFKERYHQIVRGLLATNFNAAQLFPEIDAMAAAIRPALANDRLVPLPQFEAALAELTPPETPAAANAGRFDPRRGGPGGPGGLGRSRAPLKAFIHQRTESVRLQLAGKATGHVPRELGRGFNAGPGPAGPPPGRPQ
jgi:hypothetical protein